MALTQACIISVLNMLEIEEFGGKQMCRLALFGFAVLCHPLAHLKGPQTVPEVRR